jgi:hypothetical protein
LEGEEWFAGSRNAGGSVLGRRLVCKSGTPQLQSGKIPETPTGSRSIRSRMLVNVIRKRRENAWAKIVPRRPAAMVHWVTSMAYSGQKRSRLPRYMDMASYPSLDQYTTKLII